MIDKFYALYKFVSDRLGVENIKLEELHSPNGVIMEIDSRGFSPVVDKIEISLYDDDIFRGFMLIDDFRFEYNSNEDDAIEDIKRYINAIKMQKIYIKGYKLLGVTFNKKLLIEDSGAHGTHL
ncbi:MAG TPA: hypothetical protein VD735_04425 [Candidatus Saccharimonadales bacterium]|nr:hypothetical protein [Candidatus Saccharimonadales bacterium]